MEAHTTVWLVKPEAPQDAEAVAAMRRAIEQDGAREGSLANECLDAARARGLSGEETYLFLAYEALLRLEETHQRHIYLDGATQPTQLASPAGGAGGRLMRRVASLAVRIERAAATHFTRISVGRG